jgi:sugar phosphate isomerase/epimerase
MQLGISSYTYPWAAGIPGYEPPEPLTALGLLDKAAALGVSVVQICDNMPLDRLTRPGLDDLKKQAADNGLLIEVGTRGSAPEHLLAYLDLAQRLGSSIVRVVVDTADDQPSDYEVVRRLQTVAPRFGEAGVALAIENHDRFSADTFGEIVEMLHVPHIGICLDTANSFGAGEGWTDVTVGLASYVVNLHIKDFVIRRVSHQLGLTIEGRPAGQGQLDVPWLLQTLEDAGRDPNAILELWTPPEANLEDTIRKEDEWARESITYLRTLIPD